MAISKHMLRKMHGVPEPTGEADPVLVARLKYHVAAARWCEKYLSYFDSFFAYIGFFIILLPIFLKSWRSFIQHTPILSTIFHDYSTQSGWAIINIFVLIFIFFIKNSLTKSIPGGLMRIRTYRDVREMELYPRTKKEEVAYWVSIIFSTAGSSLWLFFPFGLLAYLILIRS